MRPTVGTHSFLRDLNTRAVLEAIAANGPISRAQLASALHLSRPSISRVADALIGVGLVVEGEKVASKAGRPHTLLDIRSAAASVAAVDIRPRLTRFVVADLKGDTLGTSELPTPTGDASALAEHLAHAIGGCIGDMGRDYDVVAVAAGVSGAWDSAARRLYAVPNIPALDGVDIAQVLSEAMGCVVVVDNDVNYAALGERVHGAAREEPSFVYLSLGSGLGGASLVDGRLHRGAQGFAGELGYLLVPARGGVVSLEAVASRGALARRAAEAGLEPDALALFARAAEGDVRANALLAECADAVRHALVAIIVTLNPEMIVLGGSIGRHSESLVPLLRERLLGRVPTMPRIVPTQLGADAPLLGAVAAATEQARAHLLGQGLAALAS